VTLLAFATKRNSPLCAGLLLGARPCSNRSISPSHRANSSKPAAAVCGGQMMGRTDRQTGGRTDGRTERCRQCHRRCCALSITMWALLTLPAEYTVQGLCNGRVSVSPSRRSTSTACRSLGAGSRYRSTAACKRPSCGCG